MLYFGPLWVLVRRLLRLQRHETREDYEEEEDNKQIVEVLDCLPKFQDFVHSLDVSIALSANSKVFGKTLKRIQRLDKHLKELNVKYLQCFDGIVLRQTLKRLPLLQSLSLRLNVLSFEDLSQLLSDLDSNCLQFLEITLNSVYISESNPKTTLPSIGRLRRLRVFSLTVLSAETSRFSVDETFFGDFWPLLESISVPNVCLNEGLVELLAKNKSLKLIKLSNNCQKMSSNKMDEIVGQLFAELNQLICFEVDEEVFVRQETDGKPKRQLFSMN